MSPEEFLSHAKAEQDKWINPVGRLILAAASIERSVNEILEVLSPEDIETWQIADFSQRAERISKVAKEKLPDTLAKALKDHKRKYWPVMANRNAIAHNPLFMEAFATEGASNARATIRHQQKNIEFELTDVQKFADEADEVAAGFMMFAMNFPRVLEHEMQLAHRLLAGMHLELDE
ncbi:hypothetical protein [Paraburkholderia aromaticivorans]|uniref:hypothetical protein n=1 Tax=Paraburkholderia aromaticivorans TaxID=2026199 RepID=UPI0038B792B0